MECIFCKNNIENKRHYGNCHSRRAFLKQILNKSFLEQELRTKSSNSIAKEINQKYQELDNCPIYASTIIDFAKKYGIQTHTIKQANSLDKTQRQREKTYKNKTGFKNPSQNPKVKKMKEQKALKKYGVINVFQNEEIKAKSRQTCLKKYGVPNFTQSEHYPKLSGQVSKLHEQVSLYLNAYDIYHENEKRGIFNKYNSALDKNYAPIPDIIIPDKKIVIEIYGDRWHCNPKFYKSEDYIQHLWRGPCLAQDVWAHDKIRKAHIESFGYKVFILWEYDLKINFNEILDSLIYENIQNQKNNKTELIL